MTSPTSAEMALPPAGAIIVSRDGRNAIHLVDYQEHDALIASEHRDAVALYFTVRLVPKGEALTAAIAFASEIVANAPVAVRESLSIARNAFDHDDRTLRELSDEAQKRVMTTEDFAEGPRAFVEKRAPKWKDR